MEEIKLRPESPADYREVENLTREAFWNVYQPGCMEHYLLHTMRQSADFLPQLDIVAETAGKIVGHVVCVRSVIEGDDKMAHEVLSLGPISVLPAFQRKGVGRKMVRHIIHTAEAMGCKAIVLCGDPLVYARYGFEPAEKYGIRTADNKVTPALQVYALNHTDMTTLAGRFVESSAYAVNMQQVEAFDCLFPAKEKLADTPSQMRFMEIVAQTTDYHPEG